ncbi:hypothetical protein JL09_g7004, partial [Pichia kudriavzevii]
ESEEKKHDLKKDIKILAEEVIVDEAVVAAEAVVNGL